MEVTSTSNQGPLQPRRSGGDDRIDITKLNRDGIEDATQDISELRAPVEPYAVRMRRQAADVGGTTNSTQDKIELSDEARRMLAQETQTKVDAAAARTERLAELRRQYEEGRLNTSERADRAATEILSSP
jgi:anti-sigma28 factor (negative regulator of flagellin synthesis)